MCSHYFYTLLFHDFHELINFFTTPDDEIPVDPEPDYSDPENEDKDEDYDELRKNVRNRISKILTHEEWDKIVAKADKLPDGSAGTYLIYIYMCIIA